MSENELKWIAIHFKSGHTKKVFIGDDIDNFLVHIHDLLNGKMDFIKARTPCEVIIFNRKEVQLIEKTTYPS